MAAATETTQKKRELRTILTISVPASSDVTMWQTTRRSRSP